MITSRRKYFFSPLCLKYLNIPKRYQCVQYYIMLVQNLKQTKYIICSVMVFIHFFFSLHIILYR